MSTTLQRVDDGGLVAVAAPAKPLRTGAAVVLGGGAIALAVAGANNVDGSIGKAALAVIASWAVLGVILAVRRSDEPLWLWVAGGSLVAGLALLNGAFVGVVPILGSVIVIALPDGLFHQGTARVCLITAVVVGAGFALAIGLPHTHSGILIATSAAVEGVIALVAYAARCRRAGAMERARLQWAGWGVVVAGAIGLAVVLMHVLVGWPEDVGTTCVVATLFIPMALAFSAFDRIALRIDRLLVRTIEITGLIAMVGVVFIVVLLGFGGTRTNSSTTPAQAEQQQQRDRGLAMVAAAISALFFVPARNWLEEAANRRVYGERRAPDEPLQTFGARMSRAIPLDELLLQLAESLKKSMQLSLSEVWTGTDGLLELGAAVPYRTADRVRLTAEEVAVVARAHVSGNAWIQVWLPDLLAQHPGQMLRVAPLVHSGELLGVVVCARQPDQQPFNDEEERVLNELARQVALALHNSALDTALQASLDDLKVANDELRQSRARIVAAADQSRRQIERNLHDGAQQHLVALAVKLGLARQLVDGDPATLSTLLEELRGDAQTTLTELRELAHGIYPPLLMDRGLREALVAAANRSVLPAEVVADVGRYPAEAEAAVYFCCLEALQNAGKYAGVGAAVTIRVDEDDHVLRFEVSDTGPGFDTTGGAIKGHGFINMTDRLGAIGGRLTVESAAGQGAHIIGRIPLAVSTEPG